LKNIFQFFNYSKMKIYFVRHGHSDHNAAFDVAQDKSVYRSFDYKESHLTEKGIAQIKAIQLPKMDLENAEHFKESHSRLPRMDRIYSSPIIRCIETTRILVGNEIIIHLHDGLMETQGPFPCNWRPDIDTLRSSFGRYILKDVAVRYEPYTTYYLPNIGETHEQIRERINKTVNEIKEECKSMNNIMIVTHNDVLEAQFGRPFVNGEVYVVEY
jgi:broad specificity phosphatase PhoE